MRINSPAPINSLFSTVDTSRTENDFSRGIREKTKIGWQHSSSSWINSRLQRRRVNETTVQPRRRTLAVRSLSFAAPIDWILVRLIVLCVQTASSLTPFTPHTRFLFHSHCFSVASLCRCAGFSFQGQFTPRLRSVSLRFATLYTRLDGSASDRKRGRQTPAASYTEHSSFASFFLLLLKKFYFLLFHFPLSSHLLFIRISIQSLRLHNTPSVHITGGGFKAVRADRLTPRYIQRELRTLFYEINIRKNRACGRCWRDAFCMIIIIFFMALMDAWVFSDFRFGFDKCVFVTYLSCKETQKSRFSNPRQNIKTKKFIRIEKS